MEEPRLERKLLQENEVSYELLRDAFNVYRSTQMTFKSRSIVAQQNCRETAKTPSSPNTDFLNIQFRAVLSDSNGQPVPDEQAISVL